MDYYTQRRAKLHRYRVTSAPEFPSDYLELQPADNLHSALYIYSVYVSL